MKIGFADIVWSSVRYKFAERKLALNHSWGFLGVHPKQGEKERVGLREREETLL